MSNIYLLLKLLLILIVLLIADIFANDPPVADFFAVPTTGWHEYYCPEFVSLSNGEITSFLWNFGDDSLSTERSPNHKYLYPGTYTVTLIVSGPGGADTLRKDNYIKVNDFSQYLFPDYLITEPTMEAPNQDDPIWWGVDYSGRIKHGGGGRILFGFSNDTIFIDHHRDFFGDNLIIDGQDNNVCFYYDGPDPCNQDEGQDALIRIHGNDNIIRNINFDRFPEGIHLRGGQRNLIENISVNIICEDAMTINGGGNKSIDCIIRNCSYDFSEDKTIMVNNGDSLTRNVISDCYFNNGYQPVRMTGGGLIVVRNCEFTGSLNNGPRFGGNNNLVIFENNYSHETKSGIRLSDHVSALIRNNIIEDCTQYAIRTQNTTDIFARIENNRILNNAKGVFLIDNNVKMDLGGGFLDIHRSKLVSGPGTWPVPGMGGNTLMGNVPYDLMNVSTDTVMAKNNIWDHSTIADVLNMDIMGAANVDPLNELTDINRSTLVDQPEHNIILNNYPNPFNGSVIVAYVIPYPAYITIEIFDILGQKVRSLLNIKMNAGEGQISWDGRDAYNKIVNSGIYYIKIVARSHKTSAEPSSLTRRVIHIK